MMKTITNIVRRKILYYIDDYSDVILIVLMKNLTFTALFLQFFIYFLVISFVWITVFSAETLGDKLIGITMIKLSTMIYSIVYDYLQFLIQLANAEKKAPGSFYYGLPQIYETCVIGRDHQHDRLRDVDQHVIGAYMQVITRALQLHRYDTKDRYDQLTQVVNQLMQLINLESTTCPVHCRNVGIGQALQQLASDRPRIQQALQSLVNLIPPYTSSTKNSADGYKRIYTKRVFTVLHDSLMKQIENVQFRSLSVFVFVYDRGLLIFNFILLSLLRFSALKVS